MKEIYSASGLKSDKLALCRILGGARGLPNRSGDPSSRSRRWSKLSDRQCIADSHSD